MIKFFEDSSIYSRSSSWNQKWSRIKCV